MAVNAAPAGKTPAGRLAGRWVPWLVIGLWLVLTVVMGPLSGKLSSVTTDKAADTLPTGAESTKVAALEDSLPSGNDNTFVFVYHRDSGMTDADRATVERHYNALAKQYPPKVLLRAIVAPLVLMATVIVSFAAAFGGGRAGCPDRWKSCRTVKGSSPTTRSPRCSGERGGTDEIRDGPRPVPDQRTAVSSPAVSRASGAAGRSTRSSAPPRAERATVARPPWASTTRCTIDSPRPDPGNARALSAR